MTKRLLIGLFTTMLLMLSTGFARSASTPAGTSTTLTVNSTSASWGETVTLSADVSALGNPIVGGSVLFLDDGLAISTAQVVGTSPASGFRTGGALLKRSFSSGTHQLTAKFLGFGQFASSTSHAVTLVVNGDPSATLNIANDLALPSIIHFDLTSSGLQSPDGSVSLFNVATGGSVGSLPLSDSIAQLVDRVTGFPFEGPLSSFALGDFNNDGVIDLAITDGSTLKIFLSNQSDVLPHAASLSIAADGAEAIAAGDLNGDGILDLVTINASAGSVTIWFGDPDHPGSFVSLDAPILLGQGLSGLVLADLNSDGVLDIAATNPLDSSIFILLGLPSDPGRFAIAQTLSISGAPYGIAAGDLYGSGLQDLAVASYQSGEVWTLQNNPLNPGTFAVPNFVQKVGNGPLSILIADVTGDAIPDIVVCDSLDSEVSVLVGASSTRGFFPTERVLEVGSDPVSVSLLPSKSAGMPDLVVSNYLDGTLEVLENDSSGGFQKHRVISVGESSSQVSAFGANGSTYPTLVTLDPDAGLVRLTQQVWWLTGEFSGIAVPSDGQALKLQARAGSGSEQTLSNELTLSSIRRSQTISFELTPTGVYGQSLPLSATASSGLPVQFHVTAGSATVAGSELIPSAVGTVRLEADQEGDSTYAAAPFVSKLIQIEPATLRVVAATAERPFGAPNPQFTGQMIGLVAGDPVQVSFTSLADAFTPPGIYSASPVAITPTLRDPENRLSNYMVTLSTAPLTILDELKATSPPTVPPTSGTTQSPSPTPVTTAPSDPSSTSSLPPGAVVPVAPPSASTSPSTPTSTSTPVVGITGSDPGISPPSSSPVTSLPGSTTTTPPSGTMPSPSPAPTSGDKPEPSPTGSLPSDPVPPVTTPIPIYAPSPTHSPISLAFTLPTISIRPIFVALPSFSWHPHEKKRTDLALQLSEGGPEPGAGDVRIDVHAYSPSGLPALGEIVVVEHGRSLAQAPINGFFDARLLLHGIAPGRHQLIARYSGDVRFASVASNTLEIEVVAKLSGKGSALPLSILTEEQPKVELQVPTARATSAVDSGSAMFSSFRARYLYLSSTTVIGTSPPLHLFSNDFTEFSPRSTTTSYFSESAVLEVDYRSASLSLPDNPRARHQASRRHLPRARRSSTVKHSLGRRSPSPHIRHPQPTGRIGAHSAIRRR